MDGCRHTFPYTEVIEGRRKNARYQTEQISSKAVRIVELDEITDNRQCYFPSIHSVTIEVTKPDQNELSLASLRHQ